MVFAKAKSCCFFADRGQRCGTVRRFCPGPSPKESGHCGGTPRQRFPAIFFSPLVKFIFPLQTIVLNCAFSISLIFVPEATALGKDMVPKRIFFTKGVGKHRERLTSFELALRDAGIAAQNLVRVSSIFPPNCKMLARKEGVKYLS